MREIRIAILMCIASVFIVTGCDINLGNTDRNDNNNDNSVHTETNNSESTSTEIAEDIEDNVYNPSYNQAQCEKAGYFWCTIDKKCLDLDRDTGSCTG